MTSHQAPEIENCAAEHSFDAAQFLCSPKILKKRSDFIKASKARRQGGSSMMVQMRDRGDDDQSVRVGYTCSKKVGNAVTRNRAKRRLRAATQLVLPQLARAGHDYVLIGRAGATVDRPFNLLVDDLRRAIKKLHST